MARADTDPADLARQAWIMYSVGITMVVCRLIVQVRRVGFRRLASDDYVMVLSALLYTTLILTLIRSTAGIGGNGETDADVALMSQDEIETHIENAKFVNVAEHAMLCTIYSLKACMLIIYSRLTMGLKERMAVKILAGYTITGFIASEITMVASCIPYTRYWAVPVGDAFLNQCAYYKHYSIAQAVFNTTSDAMMLAIPLPLLLRSRLPTKQKIAMVIVFSMGTFVILAAILSKALSLLPENYTTITYAFWYLREASVAIYVANLPLLWPMIHKAWSYVSRKTGMGSSTKDSRLYPYPTGGNPHTGDLELKSTTMASRRMKSQRLPDDESVKWDGNSSQERIIREERDANAAGGSKGFGLGGGITKEETFEVTVSNVDDSTDFGGHGQAVPYGMGKDSGNGRRRGDDVDYKVQVN